VNYNDVIKHLMETHQDLQRCMEYAEDLERQLKELKKKSARREREMERD
jgi:hypothetical protein